MTFPEFASASDDMALLRRFLPLMRPESSMSAIRYSDVHELNDRVHQQVRFVLRARDGVHSNDGSQTLATAKATISAAQNAVDELSDILIRLRAEIVSAFPTEMDARAAAARPMLPSPSPRPSPDAGFSGFASPAGA